jgi:hypothetical protein
MPTKTAAKDRRTLRARIPVRSFILSPYGFKIEEPRLTTGTSIDVRVGS